MRNQIILRILKQGDLSDEPGFLVDGKHHNSLKCITDAKICLIDIPSLENLISNDQQFAFDFVRHQNQSHIFMINRLESLTQKTMSGRIADTLLYLSREIYSSNHFESMMSRQDLADISSMAKESAIRILHGFKSEKIIDFHLNAFTMPDLDRLEEISKNG